VNNEQELVVVIAEGHMLYTRALIDSLRPFLAATNFLEAEDGEKAMEFCLGNEVDLLLLDIDLPKKSGIEILRYFRSSRKDKKPKTIAITSFNDENLIANLLKMGADGYLSKDCDVPELHRAISTVMAGDIYVPERYAPRINYIILKDLSKPIDISEKERYLLTLIAKGFSNKEISQKFSVSIRTIETQRNRLEKKFGVKNGSHLIDFAYRNALLMVNVKDETSNRSDLDSAPIRNFKLRQE
jgi:DNA-binding NarL/FixJ family response regulator